jgi:hypothetical protein
MLPSQNASFNTNRTKRPRFSSPDNNANASRFENRRPSVEGFSVGQMPSSEAESSTIGVNEWLIRQADSVIVKPKAVLIRFSAFSQI